jgi:hypothetical protein
VVRLAELDGLPAAAATSVTGHMSLLVATGVDALGYYAYGITLRYR